MINRPIPALMLAGNTNRLKKTTTRGRSNKNFEYGIAESIT